MSWLRTDDNITTHPKWVRVKAAAFKRHKKPADARAAAQRAALAWFAIGVWGARSNCDGIVPMTAADQIAAGMFMTEDELIEGADLLLAGGMVERLTKAKGGDGGPGWFIKNWTVYQRSREAVERAKTKEQRQKDLYRTVEGKQIVDAVKRRDGDYCRYCWLEVVWADRRSARRGTIDHVDPDGPNSIENCVVSCGACNRRKADRTPVAADMELRPPYMQVPRLVGEPRDLAGPKRDQNATESRSDRGRGSGRARSGQDGPDRVGSGAAVTSDVDPSYRLRSYDEAPPHTDEDAPAEQEHAR